MSNVRKAIRVSYGGMSLQISVLGLLFVLGSSRGLSAEGWKVQLQGVKALGLGDAGRAVAEDATTVWFNPAGMTELNAPWTITVGGPITTYKLDYTDAGSFTILGQRVTGPSTSNGGKTALVPHLYGVHKLSDRWWIGLGFNAPYGLSGDYGGAWVGRYHATESRLTVFNLNPTVAVKVNKHVSIGFGLDVQRSSTTLANRLDFGSLGSALDLPLAPQGADGGSELNASDWGFGFDLSAAWQIAPRARLTSTYRAQIKHTLQGTVKFDVPAAAAPIAASGAFSATAATAVLPMPHELSIGTSVRSEREQEMGVGRRSHVDGLESFRTPDGLVRKPCPTGALTGCELRGFPSRRSWRHLSRGR